MKILFLNNGGGGFADYVDTAEGTNIETFLKEQVSGYKPGDLLIIDDMGMKQLPNRFGEFLFEIIMRRYETRSTMMTSNRPLEDWGKLIGDIPCATAILDRFLHHTSTIAITGKSYRLREQAGAKKSGKAKQDQVAEVEPEPVAACAEHVK